ncbi:MAG: transcriptional regulator, LuxR family [Thermomicrobiales bacterium]|nr:transcriptional regulator, LuxR family [Thermomicrobiales bacterium]
MPGNRAGGPADPSSEPEVGMALSDFSFRLIALDDSAESIFKAIKGVKGDRASSAEASDQIPRRIADRLRRMRASRLESAEIRFRAGNGKYRARIFVAKACGGLLHDPCLLLHVEADACRRKTLRGSCLKYNLSTRELEALSGIAMGLTSKEIAAQMNISPSTVDQFLRMVMIKTGARNRAGILAKLLFLPIDLNPGPNSIDGSEEDAAKDAGPPR